MNYGLGVRGHKAYTEPAYERDRRMLGRQRVWVASTMEVRCAGRPSCASGSVHVVASPFALSGRCRRPGACAVRRS
jgi:hypothetical protein